MQETTKFTFCLSQCPCLQLHYVLTGIKQSWYSILLWVLLCFSTVSVCVLQATTLAPTDPNGKSDPYLVVRAGQQSLDTEDRYIPKQLNPTFGESVPVCLPEPVQHSFCLSVCLTVCMSYTLSFRVFEFTVSFPLETELVVRVMDHDIIGSDDVIGETRVDLENRFYSRHRASCGLALYYDTLVPQLHHISLRTTTL